MSELNKRIIRGWLTILLNQSTRADTHTDGAVNLKACAAAHYRAIRMDELLEELKGDLPGLIQFLRTKLNWIVEHDPVARTVTANENKPDCVCPLYQEGLLSDPMLCECSKGFIERMFAQVLEHEVQASIVESILRKGARCIYKVAY